MASADFPPANVPFGVALLPAAHAGGAPVPTVCTRVYDEVVSLRALAEARMLTGDVASAEIVQESLKAESLNEFMALGRPAWQAVRENVQRLFAASEGALRDNKALREKAVFPIEQATARLPCRIGDYTDFYVSRNHAHNVSQMFRGPDATVSEAWKRLPTAYHGRASSVVVSGTPVRRPWGQVDDGTNTGSSAFRPCRVLDFELEVGCLIGPPSELGTPIPLRRARDHIFGFVLLNDWSARDVQKYEYVPLGPFTAKNFASSISPWVVTADALAPFRVPAEPQGLADVHPHLSEAACGVPRETYDVSLSASIGTSPDAGSEGAGGVVTRTNFTNMYWTSEQMVVHHTSTGCDLRPGDLLGSGTVSGSDSATSAGCLLELTWSGTRSVKAAGGAERTFLEDGDWVVLRGHAGEGEARVGFGACAGCVQPAVSASAWGP